MTIISEAGCARKPDVLMGTTSRRVLVLTPFKPEEAVSVKMAAKICGKHEATIRTWCSTRDIGRRVGGGVWLVSRPALHMMLDGDNAALSSYLDGDRSSPLVEPYFRRCNLDVAALFGVCA